jgi:hypothetical protein
MKNHFPKLLVAIAAAGCLSCAGGTRAKMVFYHEKTIPAEYIQVVRWASQEIEFSIRVDFVESHLYHLVLDGNDPIAEGWFPTTKIKGQPYTVKMEAKQGLSFTPGKNYRLCIGNANPEEVLVYRSTYLCLVDFEFTLSENIK